MANKISFKRILLANCLPKFNFLYSNLPRDKERVLMYHRIINPEDVSYPIEPGMYVRPKSFEMQIEYLTKNFKIVSIDEYVRNIKNAKKNKLLALTFDDAWIDFFDHAYPILKNYQAPATVYLPTSFIGTNNLFWTDKLALYLSNYKDNYTPTLTKLKNLSIEDRNNCLLELEKTNSHSAPKSQFMSWEQISTLKNENLITFGCHSHSHEVMTKISKEQMKNDIITSLKCLNDKNCHTSQGFCYPNEVRSHETDKVLKELGFTYSLAQLNNNEQNDDLPIRCIGRIGVHEDVSKTKSLFSIRLLGF